MFKSKTLLLIPLIVVISTLLSCGGAKVKVSNSSSFPIKEVSIGDVSFSDTIYSGGDTEYKKIEEGTYKPQFYAYDYYYGLWIGFRTADFLEIEEGGFLSGDEEYTWTLFNSTIVEHL